jgi:hypothetical protein
MSFGNPSYQNDIDPAVKLKMIERYIGTPAGRQKLAASMTQPIRLRRDYEAVGRKFILVEQLPDGALALYDKDPDVAAYVIGEEGENVVQVVKPRRFNVPLFEIATNPQIPLTQIKERRYDLIERTMDLAKATLQQAEDERFFAILDALAINGFDSLPNQNPDIPVVAPMSSAILADAFAQIERQGLRVARVLMNAVDYADLRKYDRDVYDPQTQRELLYSGIQGIFYGAQIITSRLCPAGFVYVTTEPEFLGRMPVRTEATILSADDPVKRLIGFSVFENLGLTLFNPRGLVRIVITR